MGRFINPTFVHGYFDDKETSSVNGCYQGSDYWAAERMTDKALEMEREYRQWLTEKEIQRQQLREEIAKAEKNGYKRKLARLKEQMRNIEESTFQFDET